MQNSNHIKFQVRRLMGALSVISLLLLSGCNCHRSSKKQSPETKQPKCSLLKPGKGKAVIYQVMVRLFGNQNLANHENGDINVNGVGKFQDITLRALDSIREMGVSYIWYTGVLEHATMTDYSSYGIRQDDPDIVKGKAGSPYAVKDYYDVDPDLAVDVPNRLSEYQALINRTHQSGLKVLMDFIPNHVARGYYSDKKPAGVIDFGSQDDTTKSFDAGNDFYYLPGEKFQVPSGIQPGGPQFVSTLKDGDYAESPANVSGNNVLNAHPSKEDWYETVKLNYGVDFFDHHKTYFDPMPPVWLKMRDILLYWAAKGVDGFRCDVAEMVPLEFWKFVIPSLKQKYPDLLFVAEAYDPIKYADFIHKGGFDLLYNKVGLYDALRAVMTNQAGVKAAAITKLAVEQAPLSQHMLNFLENHDEQRLASKAFMGSGLSAAAGVGLMATLTNSPVLIYFGQELAVAAEGKEGYGTDDGRTTIFDYWGIPVYQAWVNKGRFDGAGLNIKQKALRSFYVKLMQLVARSTTLRDGSLSVLEDASLGDYGTAYLRKTKKETLVFIANFSKKTMLSAHVLLSKQLGSVNRYKDLAPLIKSHSEDQLQLKGDQLEVTLSPGGFIVARLL